MVRLPVALLRLAPDDHLVGQLRAGSDGAFEILFDRHHKPLLAFCRQMLGSTAEAEDVVQETFLAAYRGIVRSSQPIAARPWLYTIARHRCISILRARREQPVEAVPERATSHLAADMDARHDLRALLTDVAQLPEAQRAALVLAELGQLSHEKIASVVGCPRQKVRALVFQARSNLAAARAARDTPCREIREHIALPRGGGIGRSLILRHLAVCEGCREFRDQVRRQRRGFASLLPVGPALGLKASVLGAVGGGGGAAAVSGGALLGGSVAATSMVAVAIVGGAPHRAISRDASARAATPVTAALVSSGGHGVAPASAPAPRAGPSTARRLIERGHEVAIGDPAARGSHPGPAPVHGPHPTGPRPAAPQPPADAPGARPGDPPQGERGAGERDERPAKVEPEDDDATDDQTTADPEDKPQRKKGEEPRDSALPPPDDESESRTQGDKPDEPERSDKPPRSAPGEQPTATPTPEPAETPGGPPDDEDSDQGE
jgi:RNA polymerase sigma factor (sigma-70 family)